MNEKIRIRTAKELDDRRNNFLEICNILDELKLKYFIQGGTLLGAKRDKKFIEWDWDVEISMFNNDLYRNFDKILSQLIKNNFKIHACVNDLKSGKIDLYKNYDINVTGYTIFGWTHDEKNQCYVRRKISFPDKFLIEFEKIEFYGKIFNAPKPIDKYLEFQYGDWKMPKKTDVKEDYMTSRYFKRDNFITKFIKFIITSILKNLSKNA